MNPPTNKRSVRPARAVHKSPGAAPCANACKCGLVAGHAGAFTKQMISREREPAASLGSRAGEPGREREKDENE